MTLLNIKKKQPFSQINLLSSKQGPSIINSTFIKIKALHGQINQQFTSIIHYSTNLYKIFFLFIKSATGDISINYIVKG